MRILVLTQYYYPEQFRINDICEAMVDDGNEVTVLTGLPNYPDGNIYSGYKNIRMEIINKVKVIRVKVLPRRKKHLNLLLNYLSYAIMASLKVNSMTNNFDIIYCYQLSPITIIYPAIIAKKKFKIPIFLYCLDIWPESVSDIFSKKSLTYNIIKKISINLYKSADYIAVSSVFFIEYLTNYLGIESSKIYHLSQHAEDYYYNKKITYSNSTQKNFVYMGNINNNQDFLTGLKAFASLKEKYNFHIHFVGSGSSLHKIIELTHTLGLDRKTTFHGYVKFDELTEIIDLADILLLFLKDNNIGATVPAKLQSYMATGKFILSTSTNETKRLIEDSNCGVVVYPGDREKLTNEIINILDDKYDYKQLGLNGRIYFAENYTLDKHIKKTYQLINKMLTNGIYNKI